MELIFNKCNGQQELGVLPVSILQHWSYRWTQLCSSSYGHWGPDIKVLWLCSKHIIHWTISPALQSFLWGWKSSKLKHHLGHCQSNGIQEDTVSELVLSTRWHQLSRGQGTWNHYLFNFQNFLMHLLCKSLEEERWRFVFLVRAYTCFLVPIVHKEDFSIDCFYWLFSREISTPLRQTMPHKPGMNSQKGCVLSAPPSKKHSGGTSWIKLTNNFMWRHEAFELMVSRTKPFTHRFREELERRGDLR